MIIGLAFYNISYFFHIGFFFEVLQSAYYYPEREFVLTAYQIVTYEIPL